MKVRRSVQVMLAFFLISFLVYLCLQLATVFMFKHVFNYIKDFFLALSFGEMALISVFLSFITTLKFICYMAKNKDRLLREGRERKNASRNSE